MIQTGDVKTLDLTVEYVFQLNVKTLNLTVEYAFQLEAYI